MIALTLRLQQLVAAIDALPAEAYWTTAYRWRVEAFRREVDLEAAIPRLSGRWPASHVRGTHRHAAVAA